MAVTEGIGYEKGRNDIGMCIDFIDVKRAYFHVKAMRELYVRLPLRRKRNDGAGS